MSIDSRSGKVTLGFIAVVLAVVAALGYRRRVERTRLAEELSVTDALTGLWNRRYLQQTIQMDVAASLRRRQRVALLRARECDVFAERATVLDQPIGVDQERAVVLGAGLRDLVDQRALGAQWLLEPIELELDRGQVHQLGI